MYCVMIIAPEGGGGSTTDVTTFTKRNTCSGMNSTKMCLPSALVTF